MGNRLAGEGLQPGLVRDEQVPGGPAQAAQVRVDSAGPAVHVGARCVHDPDEALTSPILPADLNGYSASMWLVCSQRCGSKLFRALFAEVEVDAGGEYQAHRVVQPGYLCLNCGAPAVDLGSVSEAMDEEAEADVAVMSVELLCPICETKVAVVPGEECPNCGAALEVV